MLGGDQTAELSTRLEISRRQKGENHIGNATATRWTDAAPPTPRISSGVGAQVPALSTPENEAGGTPPGRPSADLETTADLSRVRARRIR